MNQLLSPEKEQAIRTVLAIQKMARVESDALFVTVSALQRMVSRVSAKRDVHDLKKRVDDIADDLIRLIQAYQKDIPELREAFKKSNPYQVEARLEAKVESRLKSMEDQAMKKAEEVGELAVRKALGVMNDKDIASLRSLVTGFHERIAVLEGKLAQSK